MLGAEAINTKALIFNVKGEDLLFLDHANTRLDRRRTAIATGRWVWTEGRSTRSRVYGSPRKGDPNAAPDVATRTTGRHALLLDNRRVREQELLPFLFADAEDERQQYTMVIHNVTADSRATDSVRRRRCVEDRRHHDHDVRAAV